MSVDTSQELFWQWAGRRTEDAGLAKLEREVVRACAGLPLALKLAGGLLQGQNDANAWQVRKERERDYAGALRRGVG